MKKKLQLAFLTGLIFLCFSGVSMATLYTIQLDQGISFQDVDTGKLAPTLSHDDTLNLMSVDGSFGPSVVGSVLYDYYATGTSGKFFDAVSLSFDLSPVQFLNNVHSVTLRFFVETGDYALLDTNNGINWHHYQIQEGAFNSSNEDVGPESVLGVSSFDYDQFSSGGWVEADVDPSWITSEDFNLTLRLWNAKLDAVELNVTNSPASVPEPSTILLVGLGLIGFAGFSRRKIRK